MNDDAVPGEIRTADGAVTINEGRETTEVRVANTGDRPVQVGSHFHFFEANAALEFDREAAFGARLNIPAGTAVRFEPGDERRVELVDVGGKRVAHGMNGLVNGSVESDPAAAVDRARSQGFGGIPSQAGETARETPGVAAGETDGDAVRDGSDERPADEEERSP